jgi:heat shock protein HtpX
MAEFVRTAPRREVVFDRIAENRRRTVLLAAACAAALFPALAWLSAYLAVWVLMAVPGLAGAMADPAAAGPTYAALVVLIALVLLAGALFLQLRYGDRIALGAARARPLPREEAPAVWRALEALCLGAGLPVPRAYVAASDAPFAFAVGLSPERASLVLSRGLLALLPPRELEGVLAHELSHVGNQDIRLHSAVTAMATVLCLPARLLAAPFRFLFHLHWILGAMVLLPIVGTILLLPEPGGAFRELDAMDPSGRLRTVALVQAAALFHVLFVAPVVGLLLPLAVSRRRELLADADAALLTHDPPALARALARIAAATGTEWRSPRAMAHLFVVEPPGGVGWLASLLSTHPPVRERIEALAGMGDGLLPAVDGSATDGAAAGGVAGGEGGAADGASPGAPGEAQPPGPAPRPFPGDAGGAPEGAAGEAGARFPDAWLCGAAYGAAAVALLKLLGFAAGLLASGRGAPVGMLLPFSPPAAVAAGFSARKGGASGSVALGFAVLSFLFPWLYALPLLPLMPDPARAAGEWIAWSLATDLWTVAVSAAAGASLLLWSGWIRRKVEEILGGGR